VFDGTWESRGAEGRCHGNQFCWTKIAITGYVRTIATGQLVMEGDLSGRPTECRYC